MCPGALCRLPFIFSIFSSYEFNTKYPSIFFQIIVARTLGPRPLASYNATFIKILGLGLEGLIWQLLSIKENICAERPRKSYALQDAKKYFFLYTITKMRSTAFQPCITLGGLHWAKMGQKNDFLKKNALKTAFWGDTILDRLTSGWARRPIFFIVCHFFNFHIEMLPITLQMSHI